MSKPAFPVTTTPSNDETSMSAIAHLGGMIGWFLFPLNMVIPAVIMAMSKGTTFQREHAAEALNFQISITLWTIISAFACLVLVGFVMLPVVFLMGIILPIAATVRATSGDGYRYAATMRLV
jgi:uncharacterized Tic20 family protein